MLDVVVFKNVYALSSFGVSFALSFVVFMRLLLAKNSSHQRELFIFFILLTMSLGFFALTPVINQVYPAFDTYLWWVITLVTCSISLFFLHMVKQNVFIHKFMLLILPLLLFSLMLIELFPAAKVWGTVLLVFSSAGIFAYVLKTTMKSSKNQKDHVYLFTVLSLLLLYIASIFDILPVFFSDFSSLHFSLWVTPLFVLSISYYTLDWRYNEAQDSLEEEIQKLYESYEEARESIEDVVIFLARTIDAKDKYTEGHIERVAQYAVFLGERIGLNNDRLETLRIGATVHDIGKIAVDLSILNKPGKLTDSELEQIKLHPSVGEEICRPLKSLDEVSKIVRYHHEKLDGSGYPDGISGDDIPLEARIVTIVDIFDALTTDRSYRQAMSLEKSIQILREEAAEGKLDSNLVEEFIAMLDDLQASIEC